MNSLPDHSVTVVVRRRVRSGRQAAFETWAAGAIAAAAHFPGHMGGLVLTPDLTGLEDNLLVFRFDTPEHLAAWDRSDTKRECLDRIAADTMGDVRATRATGLEFWFRLPDVPASVTPPRGKMALVTLLAIFPLSLATNVVLGRWLAVLPLVLRVLVVAIVLVTLMTYAVMPVLVRLLRPWLFPAA